MRILVTGGKGGTGKTLVAAGLAYTASLNGLRTLLVDADVDNPNAWIALGAPEPRLRKIVYSFKPRIDRSRCRLCGLCVSRCPMHALAMIPGKGVILLETLCDGCMVCMYTCPHGAIGEGRVEAGYIKETRVNGLDIVVGELRPGERRSDLVVEELLKHVEGSKVDLMVVDGPAGTSYRIRRMVRFADKYICVLEPTPLSLHDFKKLTRIIDVGRTIIVLNKAGTSPDIEGKLRKHAGEIGAPVYEIPYSIELAREYSSKPIYEAGVWRTLAGIFNKILSNIMQD